MDVHGGVHGGKETCGWQEACRRKRTLLRVHVTGKVGQMTNDGFPIVCGNGGDFHNPTLRGECAPRVLSNGTNRA